MGVEKARAGICDFEDRAYACMPFHLVMRMECEGGIRVETCRCLDAEASNNNNNWLVVGISICIRRYFAERVAPFCSFFAVFMRLCHPMQTTVLQYVSNSSTCKTHTVIIPL